MVALKGRDIERFVAKPDSDVRSILVYGPDRGLVSERTRALLNHHAEDANDPFAVSLLDDTEIGRAPERLADELTAIAFGTGRRTVAVRALSGGAGTGPALETIAKSVALEHEAILIVEAGDLRPTSVLRKAFEAARTAAALPCYSDDKRDLDALIDAALSTMEQTITPEARTVLAARLGGDRLASRGEIEKVSLYAGRGARIDLDDVETASADSSQATLDAVIDAMGEGRVDALEPAIAKALAAGMAPAQMASAALRHAQMLHRAASAVIGGQSASTVLTRLRPPVHFKRKDSVMRQLHRWPEVDLRRVLAVLGQAERLSRSSHAAGAAVQRGLLQVAVMKRR